MFEILVLVVVLVEGLYLMKIILTLCYFCMRTLKHAVA